MTYIVILYLLFFLLVVGPVLMLLYALHKDSKKMNVWYDSYFGKLHEMREQKERQVREAEERKLAIYFPEGKEML
jgi:hypothetical protein